MEKEKTTMGRHRFWTLFLALVVGATSLIPYSPLHAQSSSPAPMLHAGWNLIAGTGQLLLGDQFGATAYTFQPGDTAYQVLAGHASLQTGFGYWVQVTADTPTPLRGGNNNSYAVRAPPGQAFLVGDPSGTQPALVTGADSVLTYDPINGYQQATMLQPGQGAWVTSNSGGTITVTPQGMPSAVGAASFRTISSPKGYSFKVPANWQRGPAPAELKNADLVTASPDGDGFASVQTDQAPGGSLVNVLRGVSAIDESFARDDPTTEVIIAAAPVVPEVPGSDNAAYTLITHIGATSRKTYVHMVVIANRNETVYIFQVIATSDYFNANQEQVWQIANSLQLAPPVSASAQTRARELSPEEAVIGLSPYRLSAQDAPPAYSVGSPYTPGTAVTFAALDSSPSDRFATYQNAGFVVRYSQRLVPTVQPTAIPDATGSFAISLFADAASAHDYATGVTFPFTANTNPRGEPVALGATLGDASAAWHTTFTPPGGPAEGYYIVRWQRGQLVFALATAPQPPGQEQQADAKALAPAIEATERSRPALNLGPATVTPAATEPQRLQAALQLKPFLAVANAAPDGYSLSSSYFQHPAESIYDDADPVAMLHKVDEQWKVVMTARQYFTNKQDSRLTSGAVATLCADAQAAMVDLADEVVPANWTSARIASPVRLGDATAAFRDSGPNADGSPGEEISIGWTHGALLLSVYMAGPARSTSLDQLTAFARQVEARFQASPLPTSGLAGLVGTQPSRSAPATAPPGSQPSSAATNDSFRAITSSLDAQLQVPSDWLELPVSGQIQLGSPTVADTRVRYARGLALAPQPLPMQGSIGER